MPTPTRAVRIPDELWTAAKTAAERQGTDVTSVIVSALRDFVDQADAPGLDPETRARLAAVQARDALSAWLNS